MNARPSFLASSAFAFVALSASTCSKPNNDPSPACQAVLDCYFPEGGGGLDTVPGFDGLFPPDSQIVRETYGKGGTCWYDDDEVARSCDDRCKGLLWQDCARSYRRACGATGAACLVNTDCTDGTTCDAVALDADGFEVPFCAGACNLDFALRCRFEDFAILQGQGRQPNEPLFSACPEGTRCNAVPPPFVDADTPPPGAEAAIGCCENEERDLLVDDLETCNE